ncbi:MAG: MBL fold metallo-hydrolase [Candidatus Pacebacteria bacterium]|nr:MBL fold metallo-hydrolase [Candidatus Paceibacterota bacterium]
MDKLLLRGFIDVNCYFLRDGNDCYIIDPGYEKERIIGYVAREGLNVLGILLTHAHIDHIGAIDCFPVPVYLHEEEYQVLIDNHKNGSDFSDHGPGFDLNDINIVKLKDEDTIQFGSNTIKVIHTPGHTIGSVCYGIGHDLYTGDTIFKGTVGRWDLPTGSQEDLRMSILRLVDSQDGSINIYPGHGDSSTIKEEKDQNPYYHSWKIGIQGEYQ